jgi:hypothetical protein
MITKKEELQTLIRDGKVDQAIKAASRFTRDFTQDEQRDLQIVAECIGNSNRQRFYAQMGHNLTELRTVAEKSLENWYLKSTKS